MAIESYATQLERVQAAIAAVEQDGQDVAYDGRRVGRADLATLYGREKQLRALAATEATAAGGRRRVIQIAPRG